MSDAALMRLVRSIVADDPAALNLLASNPGLARAHFEVGATRQSAKAYHLDEVGHYIYAGDTALHLAAAAYREKTARKLMARAPRFARAIAVVPNPSTMPLMVSRALVHGIRRHKRRRSPASSKRAPIPIPSTGAE